MRFKSGRLLWELAFSMNVALVARFQVSQRPNKLFGLETGLLTLQFRINTYLHLHPHSRVGGYFALYAYALAWAVLIFIVLRSVSGTSLAEQFLRSIAGIVCLLSLPVSWLYVGTAPTLPDPPHVWLYLELLLVTASASLYVMNRWPIPVWGSIGLLILHYVFWGWLFLGGPYFWLDMFRTAVPMVSLASSLAWGLYVSQPRTDELTPGRGGWHSL